jgi:hypothetical protein
MRRFGIAAACVMGLGACTGPGSDDNPATLETPGSARAEEPAADGSDQAANAPAGLAAATLAAAQFGTCAVVTRSPEPSQAEKMIRMGQAGGYAFSGQPKAVLCSEPGLGGKGECELAPAALVRVENAGRATWLRAPADGATLLRYGPDGITCIADPR